jgi:hypothetical protein
MNRKLEGTVIFGLTAAMLVTWHLHPPPFQVTQPSPELTTASASATPSESHFQIFPQQFQVPKKWRV